MRRCRALCWATWCWSWGREAPLMRGSSLPGSRRWHRCTQTRRISRRSRNFWWSFNVACLNLAPAAQVASPACRRCFINKGAGRGHVNSGCLGAAQCLQADQQPKPVLIAELVLLRPKCPLEQRARPLAAAGGSAQERLNLLRCCDDFEVHFFGPSVCG